MTGPDGLVARLAVARDAFTLDVSLAVPAGETVALLGPNGAGKTTVLRALAGLVPLTAGRIVLGGVPLDPLPPERRGIGLVFQEYRLFPHLSALENVAFGPRCAGRGRAEARRIAGGWLDRVGLGGYADVRPARLSGGQAQRVALARALAVEPALLLLDEPLAALDARTRLETRTELRRHLAAFGGAALLVTHDPLDAMTLADRIVVIEDGRVVQEGDPAEIARRPRTGYVARLAGLNLYRGTGHGGTVTLAGGVPLTVDDRVDGPAFVAFPPAAVALYRRRPDGSPRNVWAGRVDTVDRYGDRVRVHLTGALPVVADVTPGALAELDLSPGAEVWASVKAAETHAYPA